MSISPLINQVNLPYEVINTILNFLSHITDTGESGYYIEVNKCGKIRLMIRPSFTGIFDITRFKQNVSARYVQLNVQQWTPNGEPAPYFTVIALEQPHRIHIQATIDENYSNGFISDNRCYTYSDPETGSRIVAYVESHNHYLTKNITFHQGCVYGENDKYNIISGFGTGLDGTARIIVNPFNMIWDLEGDEHWADNIDAAEALIDLGNNFDTLQILNLESDEHWEDNIDDAAEELQLQMYM